jgi:hypothetical protein
MHYKLFLELFDAFILTQDLLIFKHPGIFSLNVSLARSCLLLIFKYLIEHFPDNSGGWVLKHLKIRKFDVPSALGRPADFKFLVSLSHINFLLVQYSSLPASPPTFFQ